MDNELVKPGIELAINLIEDHLDSVKKTCPKTAAGMILSQVILMTEIANINEKESNSSTNDLKSKNLINKDRILIELDDNTIKIIIDKKDLRKLRKKIIKRDNSTCFYCGKFIPENETPTIDHLNPKHINADGECGYDSEENLVCSCSKCNQDKGNRTYEEYMMSMSHNHIFI